eukprot:1195478-Prorocentrum_minimum.AAC.5
MLPPVPSSAPPPVSSMQIPLPSTLTPLPSTLTPLLSTRCFQFIGAPGALRTAQQLLDKKRGDQALANAEAVACKRARAHIHPAQPYCRRPTAKARAEKVEKPKNKAKKADNMAEKPKKP